jgi:hypothetical protein
MGAKLGSHGPGLELVGELVAEFEKTEAFAESAFVDAASAEKGAPSRTAGFGKSG